MFTLLLCIIASASAYSVSEEKIVNGESANSEDYPFYAALLGDNSFRCGASILDDRFVITAAHCVEDENVVYSIVRSPNTRADFENNRELVKEVDIHPAYKDGIGFVPNDMAILELDTPVDNPNVIALPSADSSFLGATCTIIGYGYNKQGKWFFSNDDLQLTTGEIISTADASRYYGSSVTDKNICIADKKTGACMGDSGGPMICYPYGTNNPGVLAGVTSFGHNECKTSFPSCYTRVSDYLEWIGNFLNA